MYNVSELENSNFLNDDNLYGKFYLYDGILEEMARFDRVPDTTFEIHIEGGEGYIPHMHICKKSGKNITTRIKLLTNEYFREKDDKMNTLNRNECIILNDYLHRKIDNYSGLSQWQFLCIFWNRYNPEHQISPYNSHQPDYTVINEPKQVLKNSIYTLYDTLKKYKTKEEELAAVKEDTSNIRFIHNPSEEIQLEAIKKDGWAIQFINNPSEKVQLAAIEEEGASIIQFIHNPSEKVQLNAVRKCGTAIQFIYNPSEKVQLAAVKRNISVIHYIHNPSENVIKYIIDEAESLEDVQLINITEEQYNKLPDEYKLKIELLE